MYHNGHLYGSHGTALDVSGAQKARVAWYITEPTTASNGNLTSTVLHQGRIATARNNLIMPALGVRPNGSAVIELTLVGADHDPSAACVNLIAAGATGPILVLAEGVGPEDGFTGKGVRRERLALGRLRRRSSRREPQPLGRQ